MYFLQIFGILLRQSIFVALSILRDDPLRAFLILGC